MNRFFFLLLILCVVHFLHAQTPAPEAAQTPFSLDSASAYLKTLAVEIGARTMGSPNERRAMEFALAKFKEFGLNEVYLMPMDRAASEVVQAAVNTASGVTVGVLRGKTQRIIVIGGHIDSAEPDVPGANDDGSGSAVVIELARILSQRNNESTLVFALFGGEEQGLLGSQHFVDNFSRIDDVALMLQVDMANGTEWLVPFVDADKLSTPEWLVKAAYEEFDALGYTGLYYPTHFFTFNSAIPGGGVGSDHQPFLQHEIPAIDFTSDVNDPIHTPQDSYENFLLPGLKRSGDLVYKLVERFDGGVPAHRSAFRHAGVPEEKTGTYFLYQLWSTPLFIPLWTIQIFSILSFLLAISAWVILRHRYTQAQLRTSEVASTGAMPQKDFKIPGLKLFLLMLVIQTFVWFSENLVALVKGVRFPWWSSLNGYYILGFFGGTVGIWVALQLAPRLRFSRNPARYFLRSAIVLTIFTLLCAFVSVKLLFYPASGLFLLSLAMIVRQRFVRVLLWLASAHFMFHFFFSEGSGLVAHSLASAPRNFVGSLVFHLFYILFFSVWSFPFLLGFAAVRFDSATDYFWLNRLKQRAGLVLSGSAFAVCAGVLAFQPTFTNLWKQEIKVEQMINPDSGKGSVVLKSNDYLAGTHVRWNGKDTSLSSWTSEAKLGEFDLSGEPWVTVERTIDTNSYADTLIAVDLSVRVRCRYRPYTLKVSYGSAKHELQKPQSPLAFSSTEKSVTFRWYSFPDSALTIPFRFTFEKGYSILESIEATFVEQYLPMEVQNEHAAPVTRTTFKKSTVLDLE